MKRLEAAIYDSQAMRTFAGVGLSVEKEGTIVGCHDSCGSFFDQVDTRFCRVQWQGAAKRGQIKALPEGRVKEVTVRLERFKAPGIVCKGPRLHERVPEDSALLQEAQVLSQSQVT